MLVQLVDEWRYPVVCVDFDPVYETISQDLVDETLFLLRRKADVLVLENVWSSAVSTGALRVLRALAPAILFDPELRKEAFEYALEDADSGETLEAVYDLVCPPRQPLSSVLVPSTYEFFGRFAVWRSFFDFFRRRFPAEEIREWQKMLVANEQFELLGEMCRHYQSADGFVCESLETCFRTSSRAAVLSLKEIHIQLYSVCECRRQNRQRVENWLE